MARISREHVDELRLAIEATLEKSGHPLEYWQKVYREGKFPRAERTRDVGMRLRWDLFWAIDAEWRQEWLKRIGDVNDSHIDTALRKIVGGC